jgi:integrase
MPKKLLTQQFVQNSNLCPDHLTKIDYFDTKVGGLLLKVLKSGRKSYYLRYEDGRGRKQEKKLGSADVLTLSEARQSAQEKQAALAMGINPFEDKKLLKDVPTFAEFVEQSYLPYVKTYKRSWDTDVSLLNNHVLPRLGDFYLDQITRRHVIDLISEHRATHKPGSTNRVIVMVRYIFNCALKWDVPGMDKNPTSSIELLPDNGKLERFLTQEEAKQLLIALMESDNPMLRYIIAGLLLTGARKRELLDAKWQDFNLAERRWTIQFNKSGKPRYIPLSDGMLRLLNEVPRFKGCDWVFPNPKTLKPYVNFFRSWNTARKLAGLPDLRIHDLRHSFASFLVNSRRSLYEVQNILGHTQAKTTQRYAHLSQDSLREAASTVPLDVSMLSHDAMPSKTEEVVLIQAR